MNKIDSLLKISQIESSKFFPRLAERTQVLFPRLGQKEMITTRFKHSYEVRTSALIIVRSVNTAEINVDYQDAVAVASMLHDVGNPAFGHWGSENIDQWFRKKGLEEGFSDNNNNFPVIEKAQIDLEPYDYASLIKYPDKLYDSQKEKYLKYLSDAIDEDMKYFAGKVEISKRPKRTVACEIMDEADRNTYVCSDLADCFCLGLGDIAPFEQLEKEDKFYSYEVKELITLATKAIKSDDKSLIKRAFCKIKDRLNQNYILGKNLKLKPINKELIDLREELYKIEVAIYIDAPEVEKDRVNAKEYLEFYLQRVEEGYFPSKFYKKKIENCANQKEKLALQRDMVGECTDWHVVNFYKENKKDKS